MATTGQTKKHLSRFLVAGCLAVGTDTLFYALLVRVAPPAAAKAVSFLAGTLVAFIINKYWTFEKRSQVAHDAVKFGALYALTLGANVAVNQLTLMLNARALAIAFLGATATSTVLNFLGQKYWVFNYD